jgi:hypothetical protein
MIYKGGFCGWLVTTAAEWHSSLGIWAKAGDSYWDEDMSRATASRVVCLHRSRSLDICGQSTKLRSASTGWKPCSYSSETTLRILKASLA